MKKPYMIPILICLLLTISIPNAICKSNKTLNENNTLQEQIPFFEIKIHSPNGIVIFGETKEVSFFLINPTLVIGPARFEIIAYRNPHIGDYYPNQNVPDYDVDSVLFDFGNQDTEYGKKEGDFYVCNYSMRKTGLVTVTITAETNDGIDIRNSITYSFYMINFPLLFSLMSP